MPPKHWNVAADLRAAIEAGTYPPGSTLPGIIALAAELGVGRETVSKAFALLEAEGLVAADPASPRSGTVVLDQRPVRVEFSRYADVLTPGGLRGPWETACDRAGVTGSMVLIDVEQAVGAPQDVADALGIRPGNPVTCRNRHAELGPGQVVQIHAAWYPQWVAEASAIGETGNIVGGIYLALTAAGLRPISADEAVTVRTATPIEAAELHLRGTSVLVVERVTRDLDGKPLEFLRVVADPARTSLVYDGLPLANGN
jgi:GntR family transcriptional regulator